MLIFEMLSKLYLGLCEILKYIAPVLVLAVSAEALWIQHQSKHITTLEMSLQTSENALVLSEAEFKASRIQAQQQGLARIKAESEKAQNSTKACLSKLKIHASAVPIQPQKNLLQQVLPDDLIKEIDPDYSAAP